MSTGWRAATAPQGRASALQGRVLVSCGWLAVMASAMLSPVLPSMTAYFSAVRSVDLQVSLVASLPALFVALAGVALRHSGRSHRPQARAVLGFGLLRIRRHRTAVAVAAARNRRRARAGGYCGGGDHDLQHDAAWGLFPRRASRALPCAADRHGATCRGDRHCDRRRARGGELASAVSRTASL